MHTIADWLDDRDPDPAPQPSPTDEIIWTHRTSGPFGAGYYQSECLRYIIARKQGNSDGGFVLYVNNEIALKSTLAKCKLKAKEFREKGVDRLSDL